MIPCPEFARRMALAAGCADEDVDGLWDDHVRFCDAENARDPQYGGMRWKKLVDAHVKSERVPTVRRDDPVLAAARRREHEAKALEDAEYAKHAVSLTDWLADQRAKPDFFEELTPSEAALVRYREPGPNEDPAGWLLEALSASPELAQATRAHPCAQCGQEAESWVRDGHRYWTTLCSACSRAEASAARTVG